MPRTLSFTRAKTYANSDVFELRPELVCLHRIQSEQTSGTGRIKLVYLARFFWCYLENGPKYLLSAGVGRNRVLFRRWGVVPSPFRPIGSVAPELRPRLKAKSALCVSHEIERTSGMCVLNDCSKRAKSIRDLQTHGYVRLREIWDTAKKPNLYLARNSPRKRVSK